MQAAEQVNNFSHVAIVPLQKAGRLLAVSIDYRDDVHEIVKHAPRKLAAIVQPGDLVFVHFPDPDDLTAIPEGDLKDVCRDLWDCKPFVRLLTWSAAQIPGWRVPGLPPKLLAGVRDCRGGLGAFELWARGHRHDWEDIRDAGRLPPDVMSGVMENFLDGSAEHMAGFIADNTTAACREAGRARTPEHVVLVIDLLDDNARQIAKTVGIPDVPMPPLRGKRKTTVAHAVPAESAAAALRKYSPTIAQRLEQPPPQKDGKKSFAVFLSGASMNILAVKRGVSRTTSQQNNFCSIWTGSKACL